MYRLSRNFSKSFMIHHIMLISYRLRGAVGHALEYIWTKCMLEQIFFSEVPSHLSFFTLAQLYLVRQNLLRMCSWIFCACAAESSVQGKLNSLRMYNWIFCACAAKSSAHVQLNLLHTCSWILCTCTTEFSAHVQLNLLRTCSWIFCSVHVQLNLLCILSWIFCACAAESSEHVQLNLRQLARLNHLRMCNWIFCIYCTVYTAEFSAHAQLILLQICLVQLNPLHKHS